MLYMCMYMLCMLLWCAPPPHAEPQAQETHRERHLSPIGSRCSSSSSCGSSRAGIVPGYQGHVPRAASHFGTTQYAREGAPAPLPLSISLSLSLSLPLFTPYPIPPPPTHRVHALAHTRAPRLQISRPRCLSEGGTEQTRFDEIYGLTHEQHQTLRQANLPVAGIQASIVSPGTGFLSPRPGTSIAAQPRRRGVFDNSQQLLAEARAEAARGPAPPSIHAPVRLTQPPSHGPTAQPRQRMASVQPEPLMSPRDLPPVRTPRPTTHKLRPQDPLSRMQAQQEEQAMLVMGSGMGSARFAPPGRYSTDPAFISRLL